MEDFGFPPNFPVETEPATEGKEPASQSGGEIKDKAKGKKVRVNFVCIFEHDVYPTNCIYITSGQVMCHPTGPWSGHGCCSDVLPPFSVSNQLLEHTTGLGSDF